MYFGLLIYDQVQPMDVIGPWEVFSFWKNELHAPLDMVLISPHELTVSCVNNITLQAHCTIDHAPLLDYLIVPGGAGRVKAEKDEKIISFIKEQAAHCQWVASVCTGAFLLRAAGLLNGKEATTYWRALPELAAFPEVHIVEERLVKSGHILLSGGVSSGIDLALAMIAEIAGKEEAGKVQLLFEYFPNETLYSTQDMAKQLPAYGQKKTKAELPTYIKRYLQSKR